VNKRLLPPVEGVLDRVVSKSLGGGRYCELRSRFGTLLNGHSA
jgi:hypothetical protein